MSSTPSPEIAAFWREFSDAQASLQAQPLRERVESANVIIERHLAGLALEMSGGEDDAVVDLIVTAHGSTDNFPLLMQVVAAAPALQSYRVRAFRERTTQPDFPIGMDGFELYAVSRFGPFKRSLFALGMVWFFWAIVGFNSAALALITSIASLVTLWLFLWPQLMMYCAAWRHFKKKVAWRSPKGIGRIFGTMGVQIDLKSAQSVRASWDTPDELKARWVEKSSTALKANKSDEA